MSRQVGDDMELDRLEQQSDRGWDRWRQHILYELGRHDKSLERIEKDIVDLKIESARLIVKVAAIIGTISTLTSATASLLVSKFLGG